MVNLSHASVCGLVCMMGCGTPAAMSYAPDGPKDSAMPPGDGRGIPSDGLGRPGDGAGAPGDGPGEPRDGSGEPSDGPGEPSDGPSGGVDARLVDAAPIDAPVHAPGSPGLGGHAVNYSRLGAPNPHPMPITTPPMTTHTGSTLVVGVGRGKKILFALPTDNKGNAPYQQMGAVHPYTHWVDSGTALYAFPSAAGGAGFKVSASTDDEDEITIFALEVLGGSSIQSVWNEVVQPSQPVPVTSRSITTTGPATLIAFWWGDAASNVDHTAVPDNDFTVVDAVLGGGSLVQGAVAVKTVTDAGTFNVTWTATPVQGAQLWLVAVQ